ncbi:hypothetical protein K7432_002304 [Basidiobolus ranarum]|uniref:TH1 protein n=2 Tax=Basidiobolus ranarum TaxID=34480 RepID=A0ABR2W806_9FUNG
MSDKQARQDKARAALSGIDAIMEPNMDKQLTEFLTNGGTPFQAVTMLSEKYVGLAQMCNIASEWCEEFEIDYELEMKKLVRDRIMDRFNPTAVDAEFMNSDNAPAWLEGMIHEPFWRNMIYELSEKHKKCLLLNFAIQRISDAGYQSEMSSVATASTYVNVFTGVIVGTLEKLKDLDDVTLSDQIPDLLKLTCQNEYTYLFTQILIRQLMKEPGGFAFKRISKELEEAVNEKFNRPQLVNTLRFFLEETPTQIAGPLTAILLGKSASPGDVISLYRAYTGPTPPSVEHLRDSDLLEILLSAVLVPNNEGANTMRPDLKEKYLWLIAYATGVKTDLDGQVDKTELQSNLEALKLLESLLSRKPTGTELNTVTGRILPYFNIPVIALGLTLYIDNLLHETSYYENYFRTTEVCLPHLLLEEIAHRHPLQQQRIFEIFISSMKMDLTSLGGPTLMIFRKMILDRLIYLMQLNFVTPVMSYVEDAAEKMDESLLIHFVREVLEMIEPPFSAPFVVSCYRLIDYIEETLRKNGLESLMTDFIDNTEDIENTEVQHLRHKLEDKILM